MRRGAHGAHLRGDPHPLPPPKPNEAAPDAAMPQVAWEALLGDAVQGLRPPHTPETLRRWLQTTHPQKWAIGAPQPPPPPPQHHHTGKEKSKGKGRERTTRQGNEERPKVADSADRNRAPGATQHGGKKPSRGQEGEGPGAVAQRERAQRRAPGGTHKKGTPQRKDQHGPPPADTARPPEAHARQDAAPKRGPDAARTAPAHAHQPPDRAQGKEERTTRAEGATPIGGAARNTAVQTAATPSPPGDDPSCRKGHHTGNGTGTRRGRGHCHDTKD